MAEESRKKIQPYQNVDYNKASNRYDTGFFLRLSGEYPSFLTGLLIVQQLTNRVILTLELIRPLL
jgi:hypothetical protein